MIDRIEIDQNLHLSPFRYTDRAQLVQLLNDPIVYNNTSSIPSPYTDAHAEEWFRIVKALMRQYKVCNNWVIRWEDQLIGGIGIMFKDGPDSHKDEVGYWLGAPSRGKGIMSKVLLAFTEYCFKERGYTRLQAYVLASNIASKRVLEKAGFTEEGYLHKYIHKDGKLRDVYLFAKLNE